MNTISLDVEPDVVDQVRTRRFRWCLTAESEPALSSTESFATRREAIQAGQIALTRAIERGCIRPMTGKRPRDHNQVTPDR